jgi:hypothetical protein
MSVVVAAARLVLSEPGRADVTNLERVAGATAGTTEEEERGPEADTHREQG